MQFLADTGANIINTRPHAFLNWVLFDNQFNFVSASSGFQQVGANGVLTAMTQLNLPITSSGYLYIYTSNATANVPVFFDNLQVTHTRGLLLEEDHYYPFGLGMAGISDKVIKTQYTANKYRFNSKELQNQEFNDGSGLDLYDFSARMQDPQIGRFLMIDPSASKYSFASPYAYVLNDPIRGSDPTGMDTYLSGAAAQQFFEVVQQNNNLQHQGWNIKIDGDRLDQMAEMVMSQYGGESQENARIRAILPVYQSIMPQIYDNIRYAQTALGKPQLLTRGPVGLDDINRPLAMKGKPDIDYDHDLYSLDEYPFASTLQGGAGAWVYPVDMNDQYAQAGQISSLYSFVQPGDNFLVIPFSKAANEYYTAPNYYKMPGFQPSKSWIERKNKPRPPQIPLPQLVLPFLEKILKYIKIPEISIPPDMVPNPSPMHI